MTRESGRFIAMTTVLVVTAGHAAAVSPFPQPIVWTFGDNGYPAGGLCLATRADDSLMVPMIKLEVETANNSYAQLAEALASSIAAHGNRRIAIWLHHFGNNLCYRQWGNLDDNGVAPTSEPEDHDGIERLVPQDFYGNHPVSLLWHPDDAIDPLLPTPAPPPNTCASPINFGCFDSDPSTICYDDLSYQTSVIGDVKVRRTRNWWNQAGIAQGQQWMTGLLTAYTEYRDKSGVPLPIPDRFHLDCEHDNSMWGYVFELWKQDPRWNTVNVAGFNTTLESLYAGFLDDLGTHYPAGTFPAVPPNQQQFGHDWGCFGEAPRNHAMYNWSYGISQQAASGALDAAVFQTVHAFFGPQVKCSEYGKSARFDKQHPYTHTSAEGAQFLNKVYWNGKGDLQAHVLYADIAPAHIQLGETLWDAGVRVHRKNLDNAIKSYGGGKQHEMCPYIQPPGYKVRTSTNCAVAPSLEVTKSEARRIFALLKSRDTQEFIVFNPPDCDDAINPLAAPQRWTDIADVIDQVWNTGINSATISNTPTGLTLATQAELDAMKFGLGDPFAIDSEGWGNTPRSLTIDAIFDTAFAGHHNGVVVFVEALATIPGVTATLKVWNRTTSTFDTIDTGWAVPISGDGARYAASIEGPQNSYVDPTTGQARVQLSFSHPSTQFTAAVDLLQLTGSGSSRLYDATDDGTVSSSDLSLVLIHLNQPASVCPACDVNCDGAIDLADYTLVNQYVTP